MSDWGSKIAEAKKEVLAQESYLKGTFGKDYRLRDDVQFRFKFNTYWHYLFSYEKERRPRLPVSSGTNFRHYSRLVEEAQGLERDFLSLKRREGGAFTAASVLGANGVSFGQDWNRRDILRVPAPVKLDRSTQTLDGEQVCPECLSKTLAEYEASTSDSPPSPSKLSSSRFYGVSKKKEISASHHGINLAPPFSFEQPAAFLQNELNSGLLEKYFSALKDAQKTNQKKVGSK